MAYNNNVVIKVLNSFENKYKAAVSDADKRRKELYKKIPGFFETDEELSETYKNIANAMINFGGELEIRAIKIEEVKKINQDLQKKRKHLLEKAGYPANYTEPFYECMDCEDSGYKGNEMCDCLKKALAAESAYSSGLGKIIQSQTFENFKLEYYDKRKTSETYKYMKSIYDDCKKFAENFGYNNNLGGIKRNLIFIGSTGLGKTHLSSAVTYEVIKKGFDVFYDSAQSILYSFEKERFSRAGTFDMDIIERYMTCDLLIIDDLGTEYSGNMSVASLYNLINIRLLEKKSMIISTNLTPEEIKNKYDERIVSRIFGEFTVLNFIGEDIRFKKSGE